MTLSLEAVSEFKKIYARQFGEKLSDAEAEQKALATLRFFRLIYSESAPAEWEKKYDKTKRI
jgi:hypothetical protein